MQPNLEGPSHPSGNTYHPELVQPTTQDRAEAAVAFIRTNVEYLLHKEGVDILRMSAEAEIPIEAILEAAQRELYNLKTLVAIGKYLGYNAKTLATKDLANQDSALATNT